MSLSPYVAEMTAFDWLRTYVPIIRKPLAIVYSNHSDHSLFRYEITHPMLTCIQSTITSIAAHTLRHRCRLYASHCMRKYRASAANARRRLL